MCASLQSGVRLHFAPRLQEAFALKCAPRFYQHWLGIRCLRRFNSALLAKWLWRYGLENDALWRRVIGRSMGMSGVVSAQNLCLGHMVFVCGSLLEVVGWIFPSSFGTMWVMLLVWSFGMMCDVGVVLLRRHFQIYIILVGQGMFWSLRLCAIQMGEFFGTYNFTA